MANRVSAIILGLALRNHALSAIWLVKCHLEIGILERRQYHAKEDVIKIMGHVWRHWNNSLEAEYRTRAPITQSRNHKSKQDMGHLAFANYTAWHRTLLTHHNICEDGGSGSINGRKIHQSRSRLQVASRIRLTRKTILVGNLLPDECLHNDHKTLHRRSGTRSKCKAHQLLANISPVDSKGDREQARRAGAQAPQK